MSLIEVLRADRLIFALAVVPLGLIVGSFLNVVVHRLPKMLERDWEDQARVFLRLEPVLDRETFNLATPPSHCPNCHARVKPRHNIPIVSYLVLRGRCQSCGQGIGVRYPVIEALSAACSFAVAFELGFGWLASAGLVLTWCLIALSAIDLETMLLPDVIVLPVLWAGLVFNIDGGFTDLQSSVVGAVTGYLALWSVYVAFKWFTGREGMGHGDFKLLGMIGAWIGWQGLPAVVLLSSAMGATIGITLLLIGRHKRGMPIPFGPFLAGAGWVVLLWGGSLHEFYFRTLGPAF